MPFQIDQLKKNCLSRPLWSVAWRRFGSVEMFMRCFNGDLLLAWYVDFGDMFFPQNKI